MIITISEDTRVVSIESDICTDIYEVLLELVKPALLAWGFHPDTIKEAIITEEDLTDILAEAKREWEDDQRPVGGDCKCTPRLEALGIQQDDQATDAYPDSCASDTVAGSGGLGDGGQDRRGPGNPYHKFYDDCA